MLGASSGRITCRRCDNPRCTSIGSVFERSHLRDWKFEPQSPHGIKLFGVLLMAFVVFWDMPYLSIRRFRGIHDRKMDVWRPRLHFFNTQPSFFELPPLIF
jgi:hypothetical protein